MKDTKELQVFYDALLEVNHKLWKIEDKIRILENNKEFNEEFIDLARSVYKLNDERFAIKNEINKTFDSEIQEQKEYEKLFLKMLNKLENSIKLKKLFSLLRDIPFSF